MCDFTPVSVSVGYFLEMELPTQRMQAFLIETDTERLYQFNIPSGKMWEHLFLILSSAHVYND